MQEKNKRLKRKRRAGGMEIDCVADLLTWTHTQPQLRLPEPPPTTGAELQLYQPSPTAMTVRCGVEVGTGALLIPMDAMAFNVEGVVFTGAPPQSMPCDAYNLNTNTIHMNTSNTGVSVYLLCISSCILCIYTVFLRRRQDADQVDGPACYALGLQVRAARGRQAQAALWRVGLAVAGNARADVRQACIHTVF